MHIMTGLCGNCYTSTSLIGELRLAYIFHQDKLPRLEVATGGRVRTFFVNKELANIDDMLAGVMSYTKGTASPLHYHEVCEHFYFIIDGNAQVETPEGVQPVGPGTM